MANREESIVGSGVGAKERSLAARGNARDLGKSIIDSVGGVKNVATFLEGVADFQKSPLGKLAVGYLQEFAGIEMTSATKSPKTTKLEVLLTQLRAFIIPVMFAATACYIAVNALGFYIGW